MKDWDGIARAAWELHRSPELHHAVRPSIPILYFGDLVAYEASPMRVVTVGLNPSLREFPAEEPFRRFPGGGELAAGATMPLLSVLNEYYRAKPYRSWFQSYEPLLNGLGVSYYDGHSGVALHTDLFSPIATDPTWSKLSERERAPLMESGVRLWHSVVDILRPHIVILSIARAHLEHLQFDWDGPWTTALSLTQTKDGKPRRAYAVDCRRTIPSDQPTFVFGTAAQTPFGTVAGEDRTRIGRELRAILG